MRYPILQRIARWLRCTPQSKHQKVLRCYRYKHRAIGKNVSLLGLYYSRAAKRGGFKREGFPIWTCPSFFVLFCPFWDFPDFSRIFLICLGMVRGLSRFVPFLFLGLLRAPTRNSPERVRDTIWTFPEKSGKHPGLETPRFSFSQII